MSVSVIPSSVNSCISRTDAQFKVTKSGKLLPVTLLKTSFSKFFTSWNSFVRKGILGKGSHSHSIFLEKGESLQYRVIYFFMN